MGISGNKKNGNVRHGSHLSKDLELEIYKFTLAYLANKKSSSFGLAEIKRGCFGCRDVVVIISRPNWAEFGGTARASTTP